MSVESRFGTSTPYSLGVEEEFQLVHAGSLQLVSDVGPLLERFVGAPVSSRIKPELLQSCVEVSTRICASVEEVVGDLADLRERVSSAAAEQDALIVAAGTHPFSRCEHQRVTERPRYAWLLERYGWRMARQLVFGLHIHVGVSSAEKAVACANGLRDHLPELLALSANSPFWEGAATGMSSTRATIAAELPLSGLPPVLPSFSEYELMVANGVRAGCFSDYTEIWWDVRLHPRYGTVEVRICDAQAQIENVAALTALVRSLAATIGSEFDCGESPALTPDLHLEENRWRAARDGLAAQLIDPGSDNETPAADSVRALVERCMPAAEALGCADELELVENILDRGNGADEQLRIYDDTHDLSAVTRWLADKTTSHQLSATHQD